MESKGCTIIIAGVPDHFHYFRICYRCMYDDGQIGESSYLLKFQSILVSISVFMPHSHKRLTHKHKIDTKTKYDLSSGTCKYKNNENFFFLSSFVLLLAYAQTMFLCLCLCRSICRRLDCILLFSTQFVLMLMKNLQTNQNPLF